ncbi:hypothetical protein D3C81_1638900 [compost metagenome]
MRKSVDKLIRRQPHQPGLVFQVLHQRVALFLDISKVAEAGIALVNIDLAQMARPVKNILIELAMNSAQMRQTAF